jgi:hypothetical protein
MPKVARNKNPEIEIAQRAMVDDAAALEWWEDRCWGSERAFHPLRLRERLRDAVQGRARSARALAVP